MGTFAVPQQWTDQEYGEAKKSTFLDFTCLSALRDLVRSLDNAKKGLIWLKDANCAGATASWNDALNFCNSLKSGSCGLSDGSKAGDWRLPNLTELESLIDYSRYDPALPQGHPFTNVNSDYYWSSTTCSGDTAYAFIVDMYDGIESSDLKELDLSSVWPVRAGR